MSKEPTSRRQTIVILLVLSSLLVFYAWRWFAIDACLDGGGRWDHDGDRCEYV